MTLSIYKNVFYKQTVYIQKTQLKIQRRQNILIKMDLVLNYPTVLEDLNQSDQQGLHLFNNLNPDLNQPSNHQSSHSDSSIPLVRKLKHKNKSKHHHKKQKQKQKLKKKLKQLSKHQKLIMDMLQAATPKKKLKKQKNQQQQDNSQHKDEYSYSSQLQHSNQPQNMESKLSRLNPDLDEQIQPIKRLRKSNRKNKIQQREGFRIQQLGLDPQFNSQNQQISNQDEYTQNQKRKLRKKKQNSKKVLTNQEIMNSIKNHGVVESEGEQNQASQYDNGLNTLYSMKDKKKNSIKINNRMFGDLDVQIKDEQSQMEPPPQNLQLQLKPKVSSISQQRLSFLCRAETIKKQRGMEAELNQEQYNLNVQQKAKRSMVKMMSSLGSQQFQDQIDLQVKVPTIARGKSADIINNTEYLKRFMSRSHANSKEQNLPLRQSKSESFNSNHNSKNSISRIELFKQIQQQTRLRRSKYISDDQIKNSFKKTTLEELEQARKRIQQKKRKQALDQEQSEQISSIDENCLDDQMRQLIEKQEFMCGDLEQQPEQEEQEAQPQLQQLQVEIHVKDAQKPQTQQLQVNDQQNEGFQNSKPQLQQQNNKEINQENQIIDELASASQGIHPQEQQQQQLSQQHISKNCKEQSQQLQQQHDLNDNPCESAQSNQQSKYNEIQDIEARQLEEQGIVLIKNRRNLNKNNQKSLQQIEKVDQPISLQNTINKQNSSDLVNTIIPQQSVKQDKTPQIQEQYKEQFKNFRKLRKIAIIIAQKKQQRERGRRYAQQFIQNQAEEGSDHQEHDDMIKKIDYEAQEKQYGGIDLDQDLVELIDNAVDINEQNEYLAFRKYLQDVRIKDREQIKKIMRGQFRKKHEDLQMQVEEDEKLRQQRMDEVRNRIKRREDEEGDGIFAQDIQNIQSSDQEDYQFIDNRKKKEDLQSSDSQKQPIQQQNARLDKFLQDLLPPNKKQIKASKLIDLGPLPQSIKLQKSFTNKTISISRLGSISNEPKLPLNGIKKTSSLINEILNKSHRFKMPIKPSINKIIGKKR